MTPYKKHKKWKGESVFGKSTCVIECPYCGTEVTAYIWSLSGSGKRCPKCKAIHTGMGVTAKKIEKEVDANGKWIEKKPV
jgi:Zn finger protein HypA/HybF involved in hydrogenase expression